MDAINDNSVLGNKQYRNKWYIVYNFGYLRDYRIVKMADANGVVREGIFIPFLQNGIEWDGVVKKSPTQVLKPLWSVRKGMRMHTIVPFVTLDYRQKMIDAGVIREDDKYPCDRVGYIFRDRM